MIKFLDPLTTAWVGVVTHKLRSFLTILGIVIGIGAVIALMSVGSGAQAQILSNIQSIGANLIVIRPGASTFGGVRGALGGVRTLTEEDALAISQQVSHVTAVVPSYSVNLQLIANGQNTNSTVNGVTTDYLSVNNVMVALGTFFPQSEYDSGAPLVVLGSSVSQTLFGDANPIGQQIRMGPIIVDVIGVLASKGSGFSSPDDSVLIPLTTMQESLAQPRTAGGDRIVSTISLTVSDQQYTTDVINQITSLLRTRHNLRPSDDADFNITSLNDIANTLSQATGTFTLLLGLIAGISLLVGGIGVMNIMLVSVLERTREIGILKALGAKEQDIWQQFIIEAALLTFAGGIVGVGGGWGVSYIISRLGIIPTLVSPSIVILAVSVSVGIGLFFGFYPAWNASRLNPIEALRSE